MGTRWAGLQFRVGVALVVLSFLLPMHGCRALPKQFDGTPAEEVGFVPAEDNPLLVPCLDVADDVARGWEKGGALSAAWEARVWYPYFLVPLWIGAAVALPRLGTAGRRRVGRAALVVSGLLVAFEAVYLFKDFDVGPFFNWGPAWLRPVGGVLTLAVVAAILFRRRAGRGGVDDVEATLAAQALLGALHAFSFPAWDALRWSLNGYGPWPVAAALFTNYRPGIGVAALGFLLVARPGYFSGSPVGAG